MSVRALPEDAGLIRAIARTLREHRNFKQALSDMHDKFLAGETQGSVRIDTGIRTVTLAPDFDPTTLDSPPPPNFKFQRYPMWANGMLVNNPDEEARARSRPAPNPAPVQKSDWDKAASALEQQAKDIRKEQAEQEIRNHQFAAGVR